MDSKDTPQDIIERQILELENQIARLREQKSRMMNRVSADTGNALPVKNLPAQNFTPDEKIKIFRNYFLGRDDVFARRWCNNRTGKSGYSPACKHEWVRDICCKPKVKCSDCPNRAFLPLDDIAIRQHLTGAQVVGAYPLLLDETCHFLALDFDGKTWRDDIFRCKTHLHRSQYPGGNRTLAFRRWRTPLDIFCR